jgi:NAD(P)-dependent dehydrogenase (short-subunit alcohol dehydrogenase family)
LSELERAAEGRIEVVSLDVRDEASIAAAAAKVSKLHLLMNVAGLLHDDTLGPEKRLADMDPTNMRRVFEVNAFGPLLVAKHFASALIHQERAVLANVSARVGSIGDNRLGGWYSYRASKAAQNMFTKNLAIELGRRSPHVVVVGMHPGTVDTDLSKPFQRSVPPGQLFDVERAASQLLGVIERLGPEDSGSFVAYDGQAIPW